MKIRKLFTVYFLAIFIAFVAIAILVGIDMKTPAIFIAVGGIFFTLIMALPLGNVEWHKTYDEMVKEQRESIRQSRNASKLIDVVKRNAFKKDILTKEEANKILDRTYEETLND
jgi:hypothetical protein